MSHPTNLELLKKIESYKQHLSNRVLDLVMVSNTIQNLLRSIYNDRKVLAISKDAWCEMHQQALNDIQKKTGVSINMEDFGTIKIALGTLENNLAREKIELQHFVNKLGEVILLDITQEQLLNATAQSKEVVDEVLRPCYALYRDCDLQYQEWEWHGYNLNAAKFWDNLEQKMRQVLKWDHVEQRVLQGLNGLPEDDQHKIHRNMQAFKKSVTNWLDCVKHSSSKKNDEKQKHQESSKKLWKEVTIAFNNVIHACFQSLEKCLKNLTVKKSKTEQLVNGSSVDHSSGKRKK